MSNEKMREALLKAEFALWVCSEHNALHHGEAHNTVIEAKSAHALIKAALAAFDVKAPPEMGEAEITKCWEQMSGGLDKYGSFARNVIAARDAQWQAATESPRPEPVPMPDERIDHIADLIVKGMPDGIEGFCKTWGWQQFARALLADCAGHYAIPSPSYAHGHNGDSITIYADGKPVYWVPVDVGVVRDARAEFESMNRDSYGFKRSPLGTYRNPPIARDWKWFQAGIDFAKKGGQR